jgi:membrane-bound ClpP family serine protease
MTFGLAGIVVALLAAALLFFSYVGVVQLWREEQVGLLVVLLALCLFGVGLLAFAIAGVVKLGAWRSYGRARAARRRHTEAG